MLCHSTLRLNRLTSHSAHQYSRRSSQIVRFFLTRHTTPSPPDLALGINKVNVTQHVVLDPERTFDLHVSLRRTKSTYIPPFAPGNHVALPSVLRYRSFE